MCVCVLLLLKLELWILNMYLSINIHVLRLVPWENKQCSLTLSLCNHPSASRYTASHSSLDASGWLECCFNLISLNASLIKAYILSGSYKLDTNLTSWITSRPFCLAKSASTYRFLALSTDCQIPKLLLLLCLLPASWFSGPATLLLHITQVIIL